MIAAIAGVLMALVLVMRGVRARGMTSRDMLLMGLAWVAIIAALAFVLHRQAGLVALWRR